MRSNPARVQSDDDCPDDFSHGDTPSSAKGTVFFLKSVNPRDELEMFTPLFTPRDEISVLFSKMDGRTKGFTPRGQHHP
jgi:hypothetical protein